MKLEGMANRRTKWDCKFKKHLGTGWNPHYSGMATWAN